MSGNSSTTQVSTWTWNEVLSKYPRKEDEYPGAAPVSAFKIQKAPLAQCWGSIAFKGTVGELELSADLHNYLSHKHKKLKRKHRVHQSEAKKYWFVEAIDFEGYLLKVRFLGFPPEMVTEVAEHERWVHFNQVKELGYYKQDGIATLPQIPGYENLGLKEVSDRLYGQTVGKFTINALRFGWMKQSEDYIRWKTGTRVEVRNRDCCAEMLPGFVSKTLGRRVEILYWGVQQYNRKGVWVHEDSDLIKPQGWAQTAGGKMNAHVKNYNPAPLEPTELGVNIQLGSNGIKDGMLFEFINPIKLDQIAVGRVTRVLDHGYFACRIESDVLKADIDEHLKGINEFHYHITSDQIFSLGTFAGEIPPPRPADAVADNEFKWEAYLERTGAQALQLPQKEEENVQEFEEFMWVEAVDSHKPELVCPAVIVKMIHPYAMKLRFLGWGQEFDQWKPVKSLEVFPVGWCQMTEHLLEPPISGSFDLPAPAKKKIAQPVEPITESTSMEEQSEGGKVRGRKKAAKSIGSRPVFSPSHFENDTTPEEIHIPLKQRLALEFNCKPQKVGRGSTSTLDDASYKSDDVDIKVKRMTNQKAGPQPQSTKKKGSRKSTTKSSKNQKIKKGRVIRENSSDSEPTGEVIDAVDEVDSNNSSAGAVGQQTRRSGRFRTAPLFYGENICSK